MNIYEDEENGHVEISVTPYVKPVEEKTTLNIVYGRFQPFHKGHAAFIEETISPRDCDNTLVIICSADEAPSFNNPWSYQERKGVLEEHFGDRILIGKMQDYKYNDNKWYEEMGELIARESADYDQVIIHGVIKEGDSSSAAGLKGFEERGYLVNYIPVKEEINATDIRKHFFSRFVTWAHIEALVPEATVKFLYNWSSFVSKKTKDIMIDIENEWAAVKEYQKSWESAPFPPVFVAVDGLVIWRDSWGKPHILTIVRKGPIGKDKWALPGGYIDVNETLEVSAKREVFEETLLDLNKPHEGKLWDLVSVRTYDAPKRSLRGRMITHVHYFDLGYIRSSLFNIEKKKVTQPIVTGSDDAIEAFWLPIDEVNANRANFFSDHFYIISSMMPEVDDF